LNKIYNHQFSATYIHLSNIPIALEADVTFFDGNSYEVI